MTMRCALTALALIAVLCGGARAGDSFTATEPRAVASAGLDGRLEREAAAAVHALHVSSTDAARESRSMA